MAARAQYLAAGEGLLALFGGTSFVVNTMLGSISLLISSLLMLRSGVFGKAAGYVGIVTNLLTLGFLLPVVGQALLFLSVPGYLIWNIIIARALFRLARRAADGA